MNMPPAPAGGQTASKPRWGSLLANLLLPAMLFAMSILGILPNSAKVQPDNPARTASLPGEP